MTEAQGTELLAKVADLLVKVGDLNTAAVATCEAARWLFLASLGVLFATLVIALRR